MNKRGLTLVDLTLAVVIFVVIASAVVFIYAGGLKAYVQSAAKLGLLSTSRLTMFKMANDMRESIGVISSSGIYTTDSDTIVFQVFSINASGDLLTKYSDTIVYDKDGTDIKKIVIPDTNSSRSATTTVIIGNVNSLSFSDADSGGTATADTEKVDMDLTVSEYVSTLQRSKTNSLSSTVKLRNI